MFKLWSSCLGCKQLSYVPASQVLSHSCCHCYSEAQHFHSDETWEVSQPFPSDALIPWNLEENQHPFYISSISIFPHVLPSLQGLTCIKIAYYHWYCLFFLIAILAIEHRLSCIIDRCNDSELHPNFLFLTLTIWWVVKRSIYRGSWIEAIEDPCQGNALFTPGR